MKNRKDRGKTPQPTPRDDAPENPQVFAVKREGTGWALDRREFLKGTAAAVVGGAVTGSCSGLRAGTAQPEIKAHKEAVRALAISPDGGLPASGSFDKTIRYGRSLLVSKLRGRWNSFLFRSRDTTSSTGPCCR